MAVWERERIRRKDEGTRGGFDGDGIWRTDVTKELDLETIEALLKALESSEDWAQGRVALTLSRTTPGNHGVWYDDGDLCAEVHDNLGLGMDGKAYAEWFAASVTLVPALIVQLRRLKAEKSARKESDRKVIEWVQALPRGDDEELARKLGYINLLLKLGLMISREPI